MSSFESSLASGLARAGTEAGAGMTTDGGEPAGGERRVGGTTAGGCSMRLHLCELEECGEWESMF